MKFVKGAVIGIIALLLVVFVALATWEPFFANKSEAPEYREYSAEIGVGLTGSNMAVPMP